MCFLENKVILLENNQQLLTSLLINWLFRLNSIGYKYKKNIIFIDYEIAKY